MELFGKKARIAWQKTHSDIYIIFMAVTHRIAWGIIYLLSSGKLYKRSTQILFQLSAAQNAK